MQLGPPRSTTTSLRSSSEAGTSGIPMFRRQTGLRNSDHSMKRSGKLSRVLLTRPFVWRSKHPPTAPCANCLNSSSRMVARSPTPFLDTQKDDNHLALAAITTANVIVYVCSAIHYGSAASRAPLVDPLSASPPEPAVLRDPNDARRMLETDDPTCPEWDRILHRFDDDTRAWQGIDPNLPAAQWNSEQRAVIDGVIPLMKEFADEFERLGMQTSNPVLRDFAMFAAQYRRAHAEALPTYTPADNYLDLTAWRTTSVIYEACKAAGV